MGCVYFCIQILRYSLDSWAPMAIENYFTKQKEHSGYISTLFDWIGFTGVVVAGWVSDKYFHGKRHQTIFIMTCGMFIAFCFIAFIESRAYGRLPFVSAFCGFIC